MFSDIRSDFHQVHLCCPVLAVGFGHYRQSPSPRINLDVENRGLYSDRTMKEVERYKEARGLTGLDRAPQTYPSP